MITVPLKAMKELIQLSGSVWITYLIVDEQGHHFSHWNFRPHPNHPRRKLNV